MGGNGCVDRSLEETRGHDNRRHSFSTLSKTQRKRRPAMRRLKVSAWLGRPVKSLRERSPIESALRNRTVRPILGCYLRLGCRKRTVGPIRRIGKPVRIRRGPATVIDATPSRVKPLAVFGREGGERPSRARRPARAPWPNDLRGKRTGRFRVTTSDPAPFAGSGIFVCLPETPPAFWLLPGLLHGGTERIHAGSSRSH